MNSIYLMSNEFFHDHNLTKISFTYPHMSIESVLKLFSSILPIFHWYTNEMKYIMYENELINEIELTFLIEYLQAKIAIFKNDVEDYRMTLSLQLSFMINKSIKELNELIDEVIVNKEDIAMILFIMIYWAIGEKVKINNERVDIDRLLITE